MSDRIVVMFDGEIAQVGPPKEIHDRPVSKRVAEFIGKSNFVKGVAARRASDGTVEVETEIGMIKANARNSIGEGDSIECLLRPQAIRTQGLDSLENVFSAHINDVIYLGDSTSVHLTIGEIYRLLAYLPADFAGVAGEELKIGFSAANAWCLP